jgi:hypothetical protein
MYRRSFNTSAEEIALLQDLRFGFRMLRKRQEEFRHTRRWVDFLKQPGSSMLLWLRPRWPEYGGESDWVRLSLDRAGIGGIQDPSETALWTIYIIMIGPI